MTPTRKVLAIMALAVVALACVPAQLCLAEGTAGEAGHEAAGYTMAQWREFGWRIANFAVWALLLFFMVRKPVAKFFRDRRENIARTLEYLETQSRNLDEQTQFMRRQLDQLGQERETILAQYERDGAKERDRIIAEAHRAAEVIVQRAEAAIELELRTARRALAIEAGELARTIARERLVEMTTDEDRGRLALEFVEKVVKLPARKH
ncbi:MAG: ATP synthase F0 subunit B [Deltaproteobacteria bacterium]|nr:ATP synthase F0 subunit B [Deltaproteobacteria bacterium]